MLARQRLSFPKGLGLISRAHSARGDRGGGSHGPFVAVEVVVGDNAVKSETLLGIAQFDIVVVPPGHLVRLKTGKELRFGDLEDCQSKNATSDKVNSVVVLKVSMRHVSKSSHIIAVSV